MNHPTPAFVRAWLLRAILLAVTTSVIAAQGPSVADPLAGRAVAPRFDAPTVAESIARESGPDSLANAMDASVQERYRQALEETKETDSSETVTDLLAVVPEPNAVNYRRLHGHDLVWEEVSENPRVLVATVMSRDAFETFYQPYLGQDYPLQRSTWVTLVPELKNLFIGQRCLPTSQRVGQALGLNPGRDYSAIVELWVNPRDLFRPAPDPEITDHGAELATRLDASSPWIFPSDRNAFVQMNPDAVFLDKATSTIGPLSFRDWYTALAATSYSTDGDLSQWGSPWTRLGYTYDWGNPDHPVGLSEFILKIDPTAKSVSVKLERGFSESDAKEWGDYFRCGPAAPDLTVKTWNSVVMLNWSRVPDADGYLLLDSPAERGRPFMPPFVHEIDLGHANFFRHHLAPGTSYHVAVQSYNAQGRGGISTIESIHATETP